VESHRAQVSRLEQLIDASKILNSALDLENLLDVILQTALMVVHADRGTVYLLDEKRQVLWSKVSKVLNGSEVIRIELPVGKGIAGYVAGTGDTLNIRDAYLDTRFNPEIDRSSGYRTHTILCVAIRSKDGTIKGVFQLLNKKNGPFTEDDERSLDALSVHAGIAIERAYLYEKEKSFLRMTEELNVAARIQRELLPKEVPVVPGYDLAGKMVPAQAIGGDYFDFIPIEQSKLAICVGDVSGKGLPAALLMGNVQASVRGQALVSESPRQCVTNASLLLFRSTAAEKFATLFYAVLDSVTHELRFSNAGHDKPIFVRKEAEVGRLATGGVPLGILENFPYEEECVTLREGESIVICSDGIPEARNAEGLEFGEARLVETVLNHRSDPPEKVVDEVIRAVREHTGDAPQWDDMTVVAVRRNI
jgi:serine phosphatase RsbU (regulator of sigma subunit)